MRIVIDARMYSGPGIGRYLRNLITHLQAIDKENDYFILLQKKEHDEISFVGNFEKVLADFAWYGVSEQFKLPQLINNLYPDLVHFPHFNVPYFYYGNFVVTIHDLIHQKFQMQRSTTHGPILYLVKKIGYKRIFSQAIAKSTKIITPSEYVKHDVLQNFKVEEEKIEITYEGAEDSLVDLAGKIEQDQINQTLKKYNVRPPFIFYVGNAYPHKNVEGLIRAFLFLRKKYQYLQLVLSGQDHYFWERVKKEFQERDVVFTGFVTDSELVALYKSAKVFVLPSFEEGFGIPLLEAFACGTAVACSNRGSLPEVAGEAALYFNPEDSYDMVDKIGQILNNEKLRMELIARGKARENQFSWLELAKKTLKIYNQAVSEVTPA